MVTARLVIWHRYNATGFSISPRPQKRFEIRSCGREQWKKFSKYHYLSNELASACICYGLYDNENIIGFIGILHQPNPKNLKLKRVSRLVILPDYQGIGLGRKFLNEIAKIYINKGYDFSIITTAKNLINALRKDPNWCFTRYGITKPTKDKRAKIDYNRKIRQCATASFMYKK